MLDYDFGCRGKVIESVCESERDTETDTEGG